MPFGGLTIGSGMLIGSAISGLGSLFSGLFGKSAANKAAQQQSDSAQRALDFQKQIFGQQQENIRPYREGGTASLGMLMDALKSGKFGAGSTAAVPKFTDTFHIPTLAEAQATPGFQFTQQQGNKGILQAAGAAGGAISGGTLRAADTFNTNLANSTYGDVYNRELQRFGTGLQAYNANLQGYQTDLQRQAQEYQQMFAPAQLGENAVAGINNIGSGVAQNVGSLMTQQGNAQSAGTIGGANAVNSGITGATNSINQAMLMRALLRPGSGGIGPAAAGNSTGSGVDPALLGVG